jgi:hypothetical protein
MILQLWGIILSCVLVLIMANISIYSQRCLHPLLMRPPWHEGENYAWLEVPLAEMRVMGSMCNLDFEKSSCIPLHELPLQTEQAPV